jgi:hypothetical protein
MSLSQDNEGKYAALVPLITVLRPSQEFFTYMETSPLPVKGCKI